MFRPPCCIDLPEPTKDNIRSKIVSTIQSASIPEHSLSKDEQQALKRLKNDKDTVILTSDKERVTLSRTKETTTTKWSTCQRQTNLRSTYLRPNTITSTKTQQENIFTQTDQHYQQSTILSRWDVRCHNDRKYTDYRNYTKLTYPCDL